MLRDWEKKHPGRVDNIFSSLSTIVPSHLMDRTQFDFASLQAYGTPVVDGDIAFDEEPCSSSLPTNVITLHQQEKEQD
jgi:tRNA 2-thiocytidine biosynthesis protein TtcA